MAATGKPPYPPFTLETARIKVKAAQDAWNTRDPQLVKHAYTPDSIWRNRDSFIKGAEEIVGFLTKKWSVENGYRLRKELFAFTENKASDRKKDGYPDLMADMLFKIAVQFWYEWHDANGQWFRTYGLEDWTFAEDGRMKKRQMSGNDVRITENERWFKDGVDVNEVSIDERHW